MPIKNHKNQKGLLHRLWAKKVLHIPFRASPHLTLGNSRLGGPCQLNFICHFPLQDGLSWGVFLAFLIPGSFAFDTLALALLYLRRFHFRGPLVTIRL
jgi:hypothetical protein